MTEADDVAERPDAAWTGSEREGAPPPPWAGPVVVVYLNDSRIIGPFTNPAEATRWLRTVPNSLFDSTDDLEHARSNGDLWLAALEPTGAPRLCPTIAYPHDWDDDWSTGRPEAEAVP